MTEFWNGWGKPILIVLIAMILFSLIAKRFMKASCNCNDAAAGGTVYVDENGNPTGPPIQNGGVVVK